MLIIVPKNLRMLIFDVYHASGVDGRLGISKSLIVMRLRFLWRDMRKDNLLWVRSCTACIQAQTTKFTCRQLVQSWPLLTPFAIISIDIWSPGEIASPTRAKCMLNSMCDMTQFVCAVALSHVNTAELVRAFIEGT